MSIFSSFTHQYPLSKTLRFELKPIGKTLQHIQEKNFVQIDEELYELYKKIKKLLDEYHREFLKEVFMGANLDGLDTYFDLHQAIKKDSSDENRKALQDQQTALRKQIVKNFTKTPALKDKYSKLFAKDLFKGSKDTPAQLETWLVATKGENASELEVIKKFENFTTYFGGFHENRKNMYADEDKHTAIAYRLIHENLPRFCDNLMILNHIQSKYPQTLKMLKDHLGQAGFDLGLVDDIGAYNQLLSQDGITLYNTVIGGVISDDGTKVQGINELINIHHNQKRPKNERIAKLKPLHKQILADGKSLSFLPPKFSDDKELCEAVVDFYHNYADNFKKLGELLARLDEYQLEHIYIHYGKLNELSHKVYGDYTIIAQALEVHYQTVISPDFDTKYAKAKTDTAKEKLDKQLRDFINHHHSIQFLQTVIDEYQADKDEKNTHKLVDYFINQQGYQDDKAVHLIGSIDNKYSTIKGFLEQDRLDGEMKLPKKPKNNLNVANLKAFLDNVLNLVHFIKPLAVQDNNLLKDEVFYGEFMPLCDELSLFFGLYNKVRDYISQKPYSTQKYKLNFGNSTLLNGWDLNKEKDNFGIILQKDGLYYLALLDKSHKKVFEQAPKAKSTNVYQKMVYKLLPGPNKMLPKVFFAKSNLDFYNPSAQLLEKYEQGTHKKGDNFNIKDCRALIDFFKQSIYKHPEWQHFDFKFSDTNTYQDLSDFYKEVEPQGYKVNFIDIDASYIDDLVEQGKLYLFQIYNKDFAPKAHGKPNLHTLYFKELFSEQNLQKAIFKLNGEAEIFYRKASLSLDETTVHQTGEKMVFKKKNHNSTRQAFDYPIIKDRRYTQDKFLLHIPITMNFGINAVTAYQLNQKVQQALNANQDQDIHIIGIDRGETHLLHLSVINSKGQIIHQESLNTIADKTAIGNEFSTSYHTLLDKKEKERQESRKSWGVIENIKELKQGYLSQVVHKIAQLMIKYNAIVVLEDLNIGFKRGRFKVEKQVYQNFENALIKKLNYLTFKDKGGDEIGSIRNALQLTGLFSDIKSIGRQTGFLFYVPAWSTSKIDPTTGFVNLLNPKYENVAQSQAFFERFDGIYYNAKDDYFEFEFDYANFTDKAQGSRTKWTVCSYGDVRYVYDKSTNQNKGATVCINVNDKLKELFNKYGIAYHDGKDLRHQIVANSDKGLHSGLMYLLKVLLALRYSNNKTQEDFILSPIVNKSGTFFDSRLANHTQPKDADANGAYHIALKGLWVLQQIQNADQSQSMDKLNLAITNKQWLAFAQSFK